MELQLRDKALQDGRVQLEDNIFRAWGILTNARLMQLPECYRQWSYVRLGAALGLVACPLEDLDAMLDQVQDAHLRSYSEGPLEGQALAAARADRIRELLRSH